MTALESALLAAKPNAAGTRTVALSLREGIRLMAMRSEPCGCGYTDCPGKTVNAFIQISMSPDVQLTLPVSRWLEIADLVGWESA